MRQATFVKLYAETFQSKKAIMLSRWSFIFRILKFFTRERICTYCDMHSGIRELPGEFRYFDVDHIHKHEISLCSHCLGTGKFLKSRKFEELQEEAMKIRKRNSIIQMRNYKRRSWFLKDRKELEFNNDRLIEIAREGLKMIKHPDRNCLAKKLVKENQ